ncbi:MAG: ferrous iron transporter B, partial [Bacteroidetes bacterium]
MMQRPFTLALLGNPNSGKSSLFNLLTGLRQKVANFPGVTVDVKVGRMSLAGTAVRVVDLPGAYSLYPNADDERVVLNVLANPNDPNYPDGVVYVADLTNLEKHLLLLTQIRDLGLPVVLALNMADIAEREGLVIDEEKLARRLGVPVVRISARDGFQVDRLRALLERMVREPDAFRAERPFYPLTPKEQAVVRRMQREVVPEREEAPYRLLLWAHHLHELPFLSEEQRRAAAAIVAEEGFQPLRHQIEETMARYDAFLPLIREVVRKAGSGENSLTDRLDAVLTHRVAGPVIFFAIMFVVFQAIYAWAELPMGWIETFFAELSAGMKRHLPQGWVTDLLTDGVVAGLGGILVFIPQIAILFFLISILEEIGYMARVVYLFDRVL